MKTLILVTMLALSAISCSSEPLNFNPIGRLAFTPGAGSDTAGVSAFYGYSLYPAVPNANTSTNWVCFASTNYSGGFAEMSLSLSNVPSGSLLTVAASNTVFKVAAPYITNNMAPAAVALHQ